MSARSSGLQTPLFRSVLVRMPCPSLAVSSLNFSNRGGGFRMGGVIKVAGANSKPERFEAHVTKVRLRAGDGTALGLLMDRCGNGQFSGRGSLPSSQVRVVPAIFAFVGAPWARRPRPWSPNQPTHCRVAAPH